MLAANLVLVGPMSSDELRRAVELPARRAGIRVESSLAEALVAEIGDEPGGLPLLSTALVELWMARSDGWLKLETHESLGGVRGAVARLADSSYDNLTDEQRSAARRLFMRLVSTGEEGALARRTVPLSELDLERDPVLASVVERLTDDRLLTAHDSAVEVAHEALLREWPRFQEWLTEDAQGRELREHLTQSAKRWEGAEPGRCGALPGRPPIRHARLGRRPPAGAERARAGVPRRRAGPRASASWRASGGRTAVSRVCSSASVFSCSLRSPPARSPSSSGRTRSTRRASPSAAS